jgi:hypothetical protein
MQIVANTSTMQAGVTVVTDKHGHDWCVVVVKGTFVTDDRGAMHLAREQRPLVYVDEHYGVSSGTWARPRGSWAWSRRSKPSRAAMRRADAR